MHDKPYGRINAHHSKVPGNLYRKGIRLTELFKKFPDEQTPEEWFEESLWCKRQYSNKNVPLLRERIDSIVVGENRLDFEGWNKVEM